MVDGFICRGALWRKCVGFDELFPSLLRRDCCSSAALYRRLKATVAKGASGPRDGSFLWDFADIRR